MRLPSPFLVAFLVSLVFLPLAGYSMFYSLLVTEIIPVDQVDLPIPSVGDRVAAFGVWVQDTELTEFGVGGWREIHPVRYTEINGKAYGEMPYTGELFDGVWSPGRLIVQDVENPYRIANGTVAEVFASTDGDYHVHVNVDEEYLSLLRPNIFVTSLPLYQILKVLSFAPIAVIVLYVLVSLIRPERTQLGRVIRKRNEV